MYLRFIIFNRYLCISLRSSICRLNEPMVLLPHPTPSILKGGSLYRNFTGTCHTKFSNLHHMVLRVYPNLSRHNDLVGVYLELAILICAKSVSVIVIKG